MMTEEEAIQAAWEESRDWLGQDDALFKAGWKAHAEWARGQQSQPVCWDGECPNRDACCAAEQCVYVTTPPQQPTPPDVALLKAKIEELERLCDETYVAQGADAYNHACEEMERWQEKRRQQGKDVGTTGSLCDGMGWLYERLDELEATPPDILKFRRQLDAEWVELRQMQEAERNRPDVAELLGLLNRVVDGDGTPWVDLIKEIRAALAKHGGGV